MTRTTSPDARTSRSWRCKTARASSRESILRTPSRERALSGPGELAKTVLRCGEIVWNAASLASGLLMDGVDERERVSSRSEQLRVQLAELGPSFVKAGQVLANRPDIVRSDYMEELCKLQDDVPAFENDVAFRIIENELGRPIDAVFSTISSDPRRGGVPGASVQGDAERDGGRSCDQGAAARDRTDHLSRFVIVQDARVVHQRVLGALGCNGANSSWTSSGRNSWRSWITCKREKFERFLRQLRGDPIVKIPKYYEGIRGRKFSPWSGSSVIRCTDPQGIIDAGIDVEDFIKVGVVSGLRQLLEFGLFHGDPHPGNIFAMRTRRTKIAYVDFGNVAQLTQTNKECSSTPSAPSTKTTTPWRVISSVSVLSPGTDVRPIVRAREHLARRAHGVARQLQLSHRDVEFQQTRVSVPDSHP